MIVVIKILCMKKNLVLLLSLFSVGSMLFTACSDDDNVVPQPALTDADRNFMVQASYTNYAEVELGKIADSLSTTDSVKAFAQMTMTHHTAAQSDLVALSNNWSVSIPLRPDSASLALKTQLLLLKGYLLDTTYVNAQIRGHQVAAALYQYAADSSKVASVRSYANKYLPTIKAHLEAAQRIQLTQ